MQMLEESKYLEKSLKQKKKLKYLNEPHNCGISMKNILMVLR